MTALAINGTALAALVTEPDRARLQAMIDAMFPYAYGNLAHLTALRDKLARARVVPPGEVPADVVTMNSRFVLCPVGAEGEETCILVFPHQADGSALRLSVVSPLGVAVLGRRVGDVVDRPVPHGVRRLRIEELLFQPEGGRGDS